MAEELGVYGQGEGLERQADNRSLGVVGGEDSDSVRAGFDQERAWVARRQGWMDEVELLGIRIPEKRGGFVLIRTRQCLRLEVGIGFAIQSVVHRDGRGLIQSHQFG